MPWRCRCSAYLANKSTTHHTSWHGRPTNWSLPTRRGLMDYWKAKKRSLEAGNNPGSKALAVPAPKMDHGDNQDNRDKRDNSDKKIAGRLGANHFIASNSGFLNSFEGV